MQALGWILATRRHHGAADSQALQQLAWKAYSDATLLKMQRLWPPEVYDPLLDPPEFMKLVSWLEQA